MVRKTDFTRSLSAVRNERARLLAEVQQLPPGQRRVSMRARIDLLDRVIRVRLASAKFR